MATATSFGAIQAVRTIVLQRRRPAFPAPVAVSVVFRGGAALAVDLEPDHLPAGTAWQYGSTCDSLATPLSRSRDERRVDREQPEAATDWSVDSTKACAKPFAGTANADHVQARPRQRRFCVRTSNPGC